jgi:hypothetical protein
MGRPAGAAAHVIGTLKQDSWWMIVEPFAGDKLEDNLNPIGRIFCSASTICTPGFALTGSWAWPRCASEKRAFAT